MTHNPLIKKLAALFALVSLFAFSGIVVFQIQTAFGWTNPTCAPPTCSGSIMVDQATGNVGFGVPTAVGSKLVIQGSPNAIDTQGANIVGLPDVPVSGSAAASRNYVDSQILNASSTGGGGGSMVLYYRTDTQVPTTPPTCPVGEGWTNIFQGVGDGAGYGPHYLGVLNYGWLDSNGNQGGFGGTNSFNPLSSSYILNSVAIGSDSLCSQDQQVTVPFSSFYNNNIQSAFISMKADACFTDPNTARTECNRCIVCKK